ncbi:hypothetical protein XELAEV_18035110mg [Xenopus laevis]|uniref:Uncharacterized protein n=1 Tax=Xenopus laevis TaxID=8355 RepID=A0A974CFB0_XENLA|nr:hypothetical protein XELAEV_18035110mg [Xenopus laevis]
MDKYLGHSTTKSQKQTKSKAKKASQEVDSTDSEPELTMDKYLGHSNTKSQKQSKSKTKKTIQEADPTDSEPEPNQAEDLMKILGPWLDTIKESVSEVLQQITNQNQRITDAEQRIGTLEDELEKTQQLVDTQQRENYNSSRKSRQPRKQEQEE